MAHGEKGLLTFAQTVTAVLSPSHSLHLTGSLFCILVLLGHNSTDHSPCDFLLLPHPPSLLKVKTTLCSWH